MARETLEREETRARERMAELDRRLVQLGADIEREQRLATDAEAALSRLGAEDETLRRETTANEERRAGLDQRVAEADTALAAAEKTSDALTGTLADLTARRHALENSAREHGDRLTRLTDEMAAVETELAQLEAEAGRTDLTALAAAVEQSQAAVAEAEAGALRAEAAHSAARQGLDVARGPLADAERRAQRLDTEAKTLAKLLHVDTKSLWPAVIDDLTVEKGYEAALGAALGDDLEAPIDPTAPMRWGGAGIDPTDPALPEGVEPLGSRVRRPGAGAAAGTDRLVERGDCRAAGHAAQARPATGLARRRPLALGRLLGRRQRADRRRPPARRQEPPRRHRGGIGDGAPRGREQAAGRCPGRGRGGRRAEAETAARNRWRELQHQADAARDRHAEAEREASRNCGAAVGAGRGQDAIDREPRRSRRRPPRRRAARWRRWRRRPTSRRSSPPCAARSRRDRVQLAEVRAEAQALAREAELSARRLAAIAADREAWTARKQGAASQIETLEARVDEARTERASLEDAPRAFAEQRSALIGEIEAAEAVRRAAADRLAEGETRLADADRDARAALEAMGAAREESARAEERHEGGKRRLADVAHEIQEMLEVAAGGGGEPRRHRAATRRCPRSTEVEANLERLRRDRERLGAVNLRAEEELREVEAQHGSLTAERDDLVEAIKRLRQGIQNLNREARERLLASFEVVNNHFQHLFTELFGGGTAELQLIESDDPLEAGLEIVAKPPGKKPATLSLLSGGEQALTALALIFAVFLTNPAPICVLDEVDAPLDDHNIERFCDLLDEMTRSTDTRFVIITHNPITMARMNRLYGVTMAERGISQLVSVDLEGAVKLREAV